MNKKLNCKCTCTTTTTTFIEQERRLTTIQRRLFSVYSKSFNDSTNDCLIVIPKETKPNHYYFSILNSFYDAFWLSSDAIYSIKFIPALLYTAYARSTWSTNISHHPHINYTQNKNAFNVLSLKSLKYN